MACRTGCPTQDHASWGECARESNIKGLMVNHVMGLEMDREKAHNRELARYKEARRQGIQPDSTRTADIIRAEKISDRAGVAYDASKPGRGLVSV